jgi:hypothetical protein
MNALAHRYCVEGRAHRRRLQPYALDFLRAQPRECRGAQLEPAIIAQAPKVLRHEPVPTPANRLIKFSAKAARCLQ